MARFQGTNHEWTEARLELLKNLWAAGLSSRDAAAEINKTTGAKFTRSAVCGKINRMGLIGRRSRSETIKPAKHDNRATLPRRRKGIVAPQDRQVKSPPIAPREIKPFKVREIHGFAAERCEYDAECKSSPVKGRFFCEAHCTLVYLPPTKPKTPDPMRPFPRQPTRRY
jgi:hypothetical protein